MEIIGRSPVPVPLLILGKTGLIGSPLFIIVKLLWPEAMMYDGALTRTLGIAILIAGGALFAAALIHLGESLAVGFPSRSTALKTGGLYHWTRNPIYLGAHVIGIGSCLFAIHPLNFILLAVGILVHSRIIMKEEEFLRQRFGAEWVEYSRCVPRYIGFPRRSTGGADGTNR